jgi:transposase
MITIGIDVAKDTLVGVALSKSFKVMDTFTFGNNQEDIKQFLMTQISKNRDFLVASEATAEYHRTLALTCLEYKIPFKLLNPIVTKQFTRSTIRKRKTDSSDALTIAKIALTGEGRLLTERSLDITKSYLRVGSKLVKMSTQLHQIQQRIKTISPDDKETFDSFNLCISQLKSSVDLLRDQATTRVDKLQVKLLESIPGIGKVVATTLISEIGDITAFNSGKALVAFAGLDPKVKQSGAGLKHNTHLTKRGSPYIRQALFQASRVACIHDPEMRAYYLKKRNEGKRYKEAVVATSRKMLYRVTAVLKRQTPYIKEKKYGE